MSTSSFIEQATAHIERLRQRAADPGVRAALRHWLSEAARPRSFPALMRIRGTLKDEDFNTVAALYAYHPDHRANAGNFGALCSRLSGQNNSFEGRFRRLLLCDREELHKHLRGPILAARAKKNHPVDYQQLYLDLRSWDHEFYGDEVRKRWATDFWVGNVGERVDHTQAATVQ